MKKVVLCLSSVWVSACLGMDPLEIKKLEEQKACYQSQLAKLNDQWDYLLKTTRPISKEIAQNQEELRNYQRSLNDLSAQLKEALTQLEKKEGEVEQKRREFDSILSLVQQDEEKTNSLFRKFCGPLSAEEISSSQKKKDLLKRRADLFEKLSGIVNWNKDLIMALSVHQTGERFRKLDLNQKLYGSALQYVPMIKRLVPGPLAIQLNRSLCPQLVVRMFDKMRTITGLIQKHLGDDIEKEFGRIFMESSFLGSKFDNGPVLDKVEYFSARDFSTQTNLMKSPIMISLLDNTVFDILASIILAVMNCKEPGVLQEFKHKVDSRQERHQPKLSVLSLLNESQYCGWALTFLKENITTIVSESNPTETDESMSNSDLPKAPKELMSALMNLLPQFNFKPNSPCPVNLQENDPFIIAFSGVLVEVVKLIYNNSKEFTEDIVKLIPLPDDVCSPETCKIIQQQIYNKILAHSFLFFAGRVPMTVTYQRILLSFVPPKLWDEFTQVPGVPLKNPNKKGTDYTKFPNYVVEQIISPFWFRIPEVQELEQKLRELNEISKLDIGESGQLNQKKAVIGTLTQERENLSKKIDDLEKQYQEVSKQLEGLSKINKQLYQQKVQIENDCGGFDSLQNQINCLSKKWLNCHGK